MALLLGVPVVPRTVRPSVAATPVWYAEATMGRTQLDINITIPTGLSRKLILLWGSDGGEFPTAVTFDPADLAFPMIPIGGAFGEEGDLRVGAYYLDTPPAGPKTVRIETANPVWSVARLVVVQNARAGLPQSEISSSASDSTAVELDNTYLVDAYSISHDLILAAGLTSGDLTPLDDRQAPGPDELVNASFLATGSERAHSNNGTVQVGWAAASEAVQLQAVVNVAFSSGQAAAGAFSPLSIWELDELSGSLFIDSQGRSNASLSAGLGAGGAAPLLADGGTSLSVQGAAITADHHADWQVPSWTVEAYLQPRSLPSPGTNRPIFGKDTGLPQPGGLHLELYNDDGTGRIRAYLRDATGLLGTAIFVTSATGDGSVGLNTANVVHYTYDDETKTASIYLNRNLLTSKTDQNFAGLQNNSAPVSIGCRAGSSGVEQDGILDRVTFGAGVMTAAEIAARPAPTTITDPNAPGAITAVDDNVGDVSPSTTTDVDVLANDTGKTGPHYDIEIVSDPAGRLSVISDQSASAKIRITTPAAPASTTSESGTYRVREGISPSFGNPSNQATISWRRPGAGGGGGYTPFPFVTTGNPPISHSGVSSRPGYSATNPPSASIIDPMSGLQIFRLGGLTGQTLFINGTQNSGLVFPRYLRTENTKNAQNCFNADGTLMMVGRRFSSTGDPSNSAGSYLIDVDGNHGASAPWRIIRASSGAGLGIGQTWFWDPLNPLRIINITANGTIQEFWPIGGQGHSVGEVNNLFQVPGVSNAGQAHRTGLNTSYDGRYHVMSARRTSDGRWGGRRIDLIANTTAGPFIGTPLQSNEDNDRAAIGTSPLGNYTKFNTNLGGEYNRIQVKHVVNDVVTAIVPTSSSFSHPDFTMVNGVEYVAGHHSNSTGFRLMNCNGPVNQTNDDLIVKATPTFLAGNNPQHTDCRAYEDLFEIVGSTGGGTSGLRYAIWARSGSSSGQPPGIFGIRLGPNDLNQVRYLCHHRSIRYSNRSETHPLVSPDASYVAFSSNWEFPGVVTGDIVTPYVVVIPDAWRSPNNDGS